MKAAHPPRWPIYLAIAAALATVGLKWAAYLLTGSVGLLSDAAESVVNLVAALAAMLSLMYAARPVDPSHTYGHEKIEYFSSGLEGGLILVAALGTGWQAVTRLLNPVPLTSLDLGASLALAASLVNLAVGVLLVRMGREHGSIVLEADGKHLLTDVWTSAAVLVGLGLVWLTGLSWLDPAIALIVAANILWTGFDLMLRSFNGLMDHALPIGEQELLRQAIAEQLRPGMDFHALRTRRAGSRRFADFHLLVPGAWTVGKAHTLTDQIEAVLRDRLPGLEVTVHIEPIEATSAWADSELLGIEPRREADAPSQPV